MYAPAPAPRVDEDVRRHTISTRSQAAEDPAWLAHADWVEVVRRAVDSRWEQELEQTVLWARLSSPVYVTRVAVVLDGAGGVSSVGIVAPSGVSALDEAVVRAVHGAAPLTPPPAGVADAAGLVRLPELAFSVESTDR